MKTKLTTLLLLLALLLIPAGSVQAQSPNSGDVFLVGQNYTLESDETLSGSIAIIGGNVTIEDGATVNGDIAVVGGGVISDGKVNGDVVLVGGNLTVSSKISGSIVVVGGQIRLSETAVVTGDITTMGGQVDQAPGAEVGGKIVNNAPPVDVPEVPSVPSVPNAPNVPNSPSPIVDKGFSIFWKMAGVIGRALAVAAIGMLITLFLQPQLERVADAITQQTFMAGSFGLLTIIASPVTILVMIATVILIPVALLVIFILLPAIWLFGLVAIGQEVGERFTKAINQTWPPVLTTGFGTFLFLLVSGLFGLIPCFGWLLSFFLSMIAIGGVVMTYFGTRPAPGKSLSPAQVVDVPPAS